MSGHAKLSPSSAHRWTSCTASIKQSAGKPNNGSAASRQGSAEHLVSSECLTAGVMPAHYIGATVYFGCALDGTYTPESFTAPDIVEHTVVIDEESAARCTAYVEFVRALVAAGGELLVEQRVPIGQITGEDGATGTSDAVILAGDTLIICDAKFGSNRVDAFEPDGMPNKQLSLYAAGSLHEFGWMGDFRHVRMIIVQPKLNHVSEHTMTVDALNTFVAGLTAAAEKTRTAPEYVVTSDNCFFCPGRFDCAARQEYVMQAALKPFENLDDIGVLYGKLPLIRKWCDDLESTVRARLEAGHPVVGWKLVAGKRGSREWTDDTVVEAMLKKMRAKTMYEQKLLSPTKAEKLTKPELGPRQWAKLEALIRQPDGKPAIAPSDDPRPEVATVAFDNLDLF